MATLSKGNEKTGRSVITFSRTPGATCPGASDWCNASDGGACYALKAYRQYRETRAQWDANATPDVPALPSPRRDGGQRLLRIHVSGDFDTVAYIDAWTAALAARPDVTAWAYTRSWRMPELLPALEQLRALPNVQLFASADATIAESPPAGWRVAFIADDARYTGPRCMEQTGKRPDCASCGYCFKGQRGNIAFGAH